MAEQESDDKTEQNPVPTENQAKADSTPRLERNEVFSPPMLLALFSAYLLLFTAITGFGVFAYYTGHKYTQEAIFYLCFPLLLAAPIGVTWYLLSRREKKRPAAKRSIGDKFLEDTVLGRFLVRHPDTIILVYVAYMAYSVAGDISRFNLHPRFTMATVASDMAVAFGLIVLDLKSDISRLQKKIKSQSDLIDDVLANQKDIIGILRENDANEK